MVLQPADRPLAGGRGRSRKEAVIFFRQPEKRSLGVDQESAQLEADRIHHYMETPQITIHDRKARSWVFFPPQLHAPTAIQGSHPLGSMVSRECNHCSEM